MWRDLIPSLRTRSGFFILKFDPKSRSRDVCGRKIEEKARVKLVCELDSFVNRVAGVRWSLYRKIRSGEFVRGVLT